MRGSPPTQRRVRSAHESKSATVRAAAAAPSRRQQSRWQREQNQQRWLFIAGGGLVALVVLIFAGGVVYDKFVRANEVVAQIGPDSITATQLVNEMKPSARAIDAQAKQIGSGANISQYADQQKRNLPDSTLNDLIDNHVIRQEADRRGISVSSSEVDDKEKQTVAQFQASSNPSPTPEPTSGTAGSATPETAPTPAAAASPTAVPTLDTATYTAALQKLLDQNGLTEPEFRQKLQEQALRDKLQTAMGQDVPGTQEEIHVRHIVAPSEDVANEALSKIKDGADFGDVAQQYSIVDKDKGGDLGWIAKGSRDDKAFDDAAFALQPGQVSDVFQSEDGYEVVQVLERDPARALPADQLAQQRDKAFNDWLSSRRSSPDVKLQLSQSERDWVLGQIGVRP